MPKAVRQQVHSIKTSGEEQRSLEKLARAIQTTTNLSKTTSEEGRVHSPLIRPTTTQLRSPTLNRGLARDFACCALKTVHCAETVIITQKGQPCHRTLLRDTLSPAHSSAASRESVPLCLSSGEPNKHERAHIHTRAVPHTHLHTHTH